MEYVQTSNIIRERGEWGWGWGGGGGGGLYTELEIISGKYYCVKNGKHGKVERCMRVTITKFKTQEQERENSVVERQALDPIILFSSF